MLVWSLGSTRGYEFRRVSLADTGPPKYPLVCAQRHDYAEWVVPTNRRTSEKIPTKYFNYMYHEMGTLNI